MVQEVPDTCQLFPCWRAPTAFVHVRRDAKMWLCDECRRVVRRMDIEEDVLEKDG